MPKSKKTPEPIPDDFKTLMEASDFWDVHDISDYWDKTQKARFKATISKTPKYIVLEDKIAKKVFALARRKHIPAEMLVNLWLKERLSAVR